MQKSVNSFGFYYFIMKRTLALAALAFFAATGYAQQKLLVTVQQERDSVAIFDLQNNKRLAQLPVGYKPHEICYDPTGRLCYVTDFGLEDYDHKSGRTGNCFHVIDPFKGKVLQKVYTVNDTSAANGPHGIKVRPGKPGELFVNTEIGGDTMLVYDIKGLKLNRKFGLPKGSHNFWFSVKGDTLWLMAGANGVYQLNPQNGAILQHAALASPIRGLSIGKNWIAAAGFNEVYLLSKNDLSTLKRFHDFGVGQLFYLNITPDQKYILAPAALNDMVLVIDASSGNVLKRLNTGKTPINVQVLGKYAYVSQDKDNAIGVIDLDTWQVTKGPPVFGTNGLLVVVR